MLIDLRECHTACQKCFNKTRKGHDIRDFLVAQCWKIPRDLEHQRHRISAFLSDVPCVVQEKTEQGASGVVMNHQKIKSHA